MIENKAGYWAWLMRNLGEAWKIIKIIPLAFWDLLKWINDDLRKMTFSFIKDEFGKMCSWENICAGTGAIGLMGLLFWLLALGTGQLKFFTMFWWGLGEVGLFLVSTYAYWRDKP